jgi:metal-dependent amidase/aminoacylase/carboxypeptidase family protein
MAGHRNHHGTSVVLKALGKQLPDLELRYKDIHAHPELSMQDKRTAKIAADRLKKAGYKVTTAKAKAAGKLNDLPVNHSPKFAPVLHPTLKTGVETLVVSARSSRATAS